MGAESKKEEPGENSKEKKNNPENGEEKKEETQEIVLKVDMHCEACAKKVGRSLRGFQGVEEVKVDCKGGKVVVKAAMSVDPNELQDRVHKKSGRKVDILSPIPIDTPKDESNDSKPSPVQDPPKKEQAPPPAPPPVTTVVLQVGMHCEACAQALQRRIRKIPGVESVETDVGNDRVTVKGIIENPEILVQLIYKRTRKHASIVPEEDKSKPDEPKVEDQKPPEDSEKKQGDEGNKEGGDDENEQMLAKLEHWPTKAYMEYYYHNAPQLFSDENPNACSVM